MKKVLLLAVMAVFSISSLFSQNVILPVDDSTGEIIFSDVVKVDSVSSSELYTRARQWVAVNFVSAKDVIQMDDKQSGTFIVKAMTDVRTTFMVKSPCGVVTYTLTINVKDGRYKYSFSNLWHSTDYNVSPRSTIITPGDLRNEKPGGGIMSMGMKNWNGIKQQAKDSIELLIVSLKQSMNKQSPKTDNW